MEGCSPEEKAALADRQKQEEGYREFIEWLHSETLWAKGENQANINEMEAMIERLTVKLRGDRDKALYNNRVHKRNDPVPDEPRTVMAKYFPTLKKRHFQEYATKKKMQAKGKTPFGGNEIGWIYASIAYQKTYKENDATRQAIAAKKTQQFMESEWQETQSKMADIEAFEEKKTQFKRVLRDMTGEQRALVMERARSIAENNICKLLGTNTVPDGFVGLRGAIRFSFLEIVAAENGFDKSVAESDCLCLVDGDSANSSEVA